MKQTFNIEGMSCAGCTNSVKAKLSQDDRINEVDVSLEASQASLQADTELTVSDINDLLAETPYTAKATD